MNAKLSRPQPKIGFSRPAVTALCQIMVLFSKVETGFLGATINIIIADTSKMGIRKTLFLSFSTFRRIVTSKKAIRAERESVRRRAEKKISHEKTREIFLKEENDRYTKERARKPPAKLGLPRKPARRPL